ncbi:MAG: GDP-L-fucose synthase [Methanomassiliicoccales archaeon PtaU1.Bin124]|nr:MAG: GDP-L-fucose synthase [Methanomassiliicoccales archaeon PtaU1.Bin124]
MRVLLTGGSGFIGRNLAEMLPKEMEIFAPGSKELDLTDQAAVERYVVSHDLDVVVHTATWNATANSPKDTDLVLEKNLLMFFNLARLNGRYGKMVYFGSGAEYDRRHYQPFMREEYFGTHVPTDQYGLSKYIMSKHAESVENIVDLRVFGCFGPYEDWEIRFLSNAMCKALYGLPISLRQNVFFDYLWVGDLVRMTEWAMKNRTRHCQYNACSGGHIDLLSLAKMVNEVAGTDVPIHVGQPGLKPEYSGDNSRLKREMGSLEITPMRKVLEKLRDHYIANLGRIDRQLLLKDKS